MLGNGPKDRPGESLVSLARSILLPAALLFALVLLLYARALGRGFTSEDFLLVRFFGDHPPWLDLRAQLAEPWLGIRGIQFFRPVSTLLFGLEIAAFGPRPLGYVVVHLLVHGVAALLVGAIARDLARRSTLRVAPEAAGWLAAGLFAIYPLHPNTVVFVASFATLFGGALSLFAFYAYQRFRGNGSRLWWLSSLVAFCLALGSYEAAVVVAVWVAAYDHLVVADGGKRHRELLAGWLPWVAVLLPYFAWRHHLFGGLGGYADTRERLTAPLLVARDLLASLHRLYVPRYDNAPEAGAIALSLVLLVAAPLAAFAAIRGPWRSAARPWALGWVITVSSMAPFGGITVIPANGRYWYLAAIGAAISVAFLVAALATAGSGKALAVLAWSAAALLAVFWGARLLQNVGDSRRAADLARRIQQELRQVGRASPSTARLFVTGYPYFLTNAAGVNLAQVYHYGLRDAANPPFSPTALTVYPLPPLAGGEILPATLAAPGRVVLWDQAAARLRWVAGVDGGGLVELEVPGPGAAVPRGSVAVRVPGGPYNRFRLLLSAPINGTVVELGTGDRRGEILLAPLPVEFLRASRLLYGAGPIYWWIEARDGAGRLTGFTRLREVEGVDALLAG